MRSVAFIVIVIQVACSGASSTQSGIVRDSAGVRIVEHEAPDWSKPGWSLDETPTLAIGTVDGEEPYQLHTVKAAVRAPNGNILVVNTGTADVRVFDARGTYVRTIGRRGRGPGEFRYPTLARALPGDSTMVWDGPLGPRSYFDPAGAFVRAETVDRATFMARLGEGRAAEDARLLPDGRIIAASWRTVEQERLPNNQLFRPQFELTLIEPGLDGSVGLGWYGGIEQMLVPSGERRVPATVFFPAHYQIAAGGAPQRIVLGNGDRYDLRIHDAAGALQQVIRQTGQPAPVTAADRDSILKVRAAFLERQGPRRAELERGQAALPEQKFFPAHGPLLVDLLGHVWVQEFLRPTDAKARWTIYDTAGARAGHIELGHRLEPMEIGADYLLGVERDEFDAERVVLYRLNRT